LDEVGRPGRVLVVDADSVRAGLGAGRAWIYFGADATRYLALRASLASTVREIPAGPLINETVDRFRDEVLNFDSAVEPRSELRWQATDLAERNIFTSGLVHSCACALALDDVLRSTNDDLLVVVDDVLLGRRLVEVARSHGREASRHGTSVALARGRLLAEGLAHRIYFAATWARTRRAVRRRLDAKRPQPQLDVLLVTWADPETFPPGKPVEDERYFGTLPSELRAEGKTVGFLANLTTWAHAVEQIADGLGAAADPIVVPEETLGLRDVVALMLGTLASPARVRGRFAPGGLDLSPLIEDELRREWAKPRQLQALQWFHVGRYLARRGRPSRVIFPFENQPWEKTLRLGLRAALPETESEGYQHTPFSEHWFPYFPSRRDLAAGQLPDRVLTIGPLWRRVLEASGYPAERLGSIRALRQRDLIGMQPRAARSTEDPVALVACSIGRSDSLELVVKALGALEQLADIHVRVKLHPKMDGSAETFVRTLLDALGRQELPANVELVGGSSIDALGEADVLLYNTTSVAYEALALGVPVVFVQSDFFFDVDPLPPGNEARVAARTPEEIRAAVEKLLAESPADAERRLQAAQELLAEAFT
jgi:glycosyltransferase involved in cell wall biosynthesis